MNKSASPNQTRDRRQGSRAQERQAAQRQIRMLIVAVVGVVIVAAVLIAVFAGGGDKKSSSTTATAVDAMSLATSIAAIPAETFDAVGAGTASGVPTAYDGTAIAKDGKPELLYVGAEYCPFCAAERWAIVAALSRFGSFSNLSLTTSAAQDVFPNTPTFSFYGSTYTSEYLVFTSVETETNDGKTLQVPTDDQIAVVKETGKGGIPFLSFGGKYYISGATYDPGVISERNAPGIAQLMADPAHPIAMSVLGAANGITAAICGMTNNQPAAVCESPGVIAAKAAAGI